MESYDKGNEWDGIFSGSYFSKGKKAEEYYEYYTDGSIKSEGLVIDDNTKVGNWINYYNDGAKKSNGHLKIIRNLVNGFIFIKVERRRKRVHI